MGADTVGRREHLGRIVSALTAVADGGPGHVIELVGEAGIGKSTLMNAVAERARLEGWRVLRAAPTAAETALPWTGLAQLAPDLGAIAPEAAAQTAQIDVALSPGRPAPADPELIAFALTSILDLVRRPATPVLIAIDDIQWLDPASAGALAYALRGTPARSCLALLAARLGEPVPFEPHRLLAAEHVTGIELPGLSLAALREAISAATGHTFGRGELAQIHQRTGGNPLYAIELARTVLDGVPLDTAALPASLRETIGRRVRALPDPTRRALGAAALAVHPGIDLLRAALPDLDVLAALEPAEAEQVVRLIRAPGAGPNVAFRHPLLASAAVDALATSTRIALSRALAAAVNDPVERAGYLQADLRADADLAEQLEQAARAAAERGAADTAAALARSCVTATPPDAPPLVRVGRHILHGQWELYSGRVEPAREALGAARELLADVPPDQPDRAAAAESCAFFDAVSTAFLDDVVAAASITERALETVRDPGLRARLHRQLLVMVQHVDITRGAELAEQFFGAGGEHAGDPESVGVVLTARAAAGHPVDVDAALAEAELLEPAARDARLRQITELLVWTDHPRTGEVIERAVQHLDRLGFRIASLQDLSQLTIHQFLRGDWAAAERGLEHLTEYSHEHSQPDSAAGQLALLRAGQGRSEEAERIVAGLERRLADASADPAETLWVATRVGVTAHTLGHPDAADRLLTAEQLARDLRTRAVRGLNCRRDLVEALVAAGRLDEALDASARLSDDAAYNRVATALADADAAAGVVAAASGDFDTATTRFAAAAETQRAHGLRYEVARTLLAAGSAARRGGARGVAREHLDEALALFTSMGASAWARRCADELERIKGRRASDQSGELSPSEHQVAELVAAGRTNAEIAAALFVSVRTVESHLTRTYRKLGVRSRTELTARVNAGGLTVAP